LDFHEFVAINRTLRQEEKTAETFIWMVQDAPEDARRLFGIARDALIKQREMKPALEGNVPIPFP